MSILIKEMKMPPSCGECHFLSYSYNVPVCSVTGEIFTIPYNRSLRQVLQERKSNCPLEEVTEKVRYGKNLDVEYPSLFECSLCHWSCWDTLCGDTSTYNYCPNCGAKMINNTKE